MSKSPKFTDMHRFPVPYKSSRETNITETFARAERELQKQKERERLNAQEARSKTISLRRGR